MAILCKKDCTTCNSFTFFSQEVSLGLMILNSRKERDANDLPANSLPAIFEIQDDYIMLISFQSRLLLN
ncbi:Uncharacterized protein TCM_031001 [Theobroma cacao]|uniref:Uncharacterized protein n=1 Tax=Theobroma cacao TaxID=3641 RepID=A0A061F566_THECC|nr:Uncharacterized protein TCM_031001 [Theobroma cacao]